MKYILTNSQFFHQKFGGVTRYTAILYQKINKRKNDINIIAPLYKNKFLLDLDTQKISGLYFSKYPNFKFLRTLNNFFLERKLLNKKIKAIHECYYPETLISTKSKRILTVHDLIHEKRLNEYKNINFELRRKIFDKTDKIICVSNKTKNDLIEFYKINENKINVIYHGSDHINEIQDINHEYNFMKDPYLLYVGSRKKYKNFKILLDVFLQSKKLFKDFKIICFGNEKINNQTEKDFFIKKKLLFVHGNDSLLKKLYLQSSGLINTSEDEGFGLPLLEAMALGCNVFAPNLDVFKEIFSDKIFYYEKNNIESFKFTLENYLYKTELLNQMQVNAKKFSNKFNWQNTADETFKTYT